MDVPATEGNMFQSLKKMIHDPRTWTQFLKAHAMKLYWLLNLLPKCMQFKNQQ